jgi:ribonuclease Z
MARDCCSTRARGHSGRCCFADTEAGLAREYGHLTAGQAGRIAAESRARLLVLTHFSQRYEHDDGQRLAAQAATAFGGPVILAQDLDRIPVPSRHLPIT